MNDDINDVVMEQIKNMDITRRIGRAAHGSLPVDDRDIVEVMRVIDPITGSPPGFTMPLIGATKLLAHESRFVPSFDEERMR